MSFQFIFGGSGTGKSTYIFNNIIDRSQREEDKNFFIIVPDQFTMQTQMDLVTHHPRGGIMNIDVLSFSRLAYRIFAETGGNIQPVLDDTGKSLVLRKVAENCSEKLTMLGSNIKKQGYIHEVKSAISELMQYDIGEKEMEEMLEVSKKRGTLHGKLKDLQILYQEFLEYIDSKFITTEEIYDRLAMQLDKSSLIKDSIVVLDGFTGFTPVQNKVIRKILSYASEVYMTVTIDKKSILSKGAENRSSGQRGIEESGLFALSEKTIRSFKNLALETNTEELESVWMEEDGIRYQNSNELSHLEKHLFRYPYVPYNKELENIRITKSGTMEDEVRQVCKKIRSLLRKGYCYRDIAVITGEPAEYSGVIEDLFEQYKIPYFMDETKRITLNPFIEYIRAALSVLVKQFSYETVFHYLRSGLVDIEREDTDLLEEYCLAYGIKGRKTWSGVFVKGSNDSERLKKINILREKMMDDFSVFKTGKQKVKKQLQQLYDFLVKNNSYEKIGKYEIYFQEKGDKSKEKEYSQIYSLVMDLLEQVAGLLGEEVLSWEELAQILDAGFGEIQVGVIPQAVDRVVVGNMERTRLKQVKALFFLGMNEGKVPKTASAGGILSDIDREYLAAARMELAPTPRQQMFIQKFYLYLCLTKPSSYLYLSYSSLNGEGKALKPSYYVEQLKRLFPMLKEDTGNYEGFDFIETYEEAAIFAALSLPDYKAGNYREKEEAVLLSLLNVIKDENPSSFKQLLEGAFYRYENMPISREAVEAIYNATLYSSVSRLEKMAACAYAHYLQYGLGLKERQEYGFEAVDMGNIFHGVLEIFAGKLAENNYTWINFPQEQGRVILHEALEVYAINYGNTVLYSTARNEYALEKIERILWRSVRILQYQLQKGKFLPKSFELSFSALEDLDSVTIKLGDEEKLKLGGRIDRVDTCSKENHIYVKVMDYKSGNQKFQLAALYHGLQLQLVIYLQAAMELERKQNPDIYVHPGAFLYYHVDDPMIEGHQGMTEEEIDLQIKQQLRGRGIVNSDPEVLKMLDTTHCVKSDVIPVEYKKDGSLGARSSIMTEEQIELLQTFAAKKAADLGREILAGNIGIMPVALGDRDACTFCQFKQICEFDEKLDGFEKRILEEPDDDEILSRMREETSMEAKE